MQIYCYIQVNKIDTKSGKRANMMTQKTTKNTERKVEANPQNESKQKPVEIISLDMGEEGEPLHTGVKLDKRDEERWELNPESAEEPS